MTDDFQRIGNLMVEAARGEDAKILLYSEVEDGVISAGLYCQAAPGGVVRFRIAPDELVNLVYEFWEAGDAVIQPRSWATIEFVVEGGRFATEMKYPDQLNPNEGRFERRPRILQQHFPGAEIDFSAPEG